MTRPGRVPRQRPTPRTRRRDQAGRIAAQYADTLGAGPAQSLADCHTRTTYTARPVADAAATLLGWVGNTQLEPYECDWCGDWHLRRPPGV